MPSRPWLPLCALLALGCASNPSPTDAGTDTPAPLDGGTDVAPPEDRPAALDVVAADTPDVNQTEIAPMVDAPDVVDAGGEDAPDAVAVVDAPALDTPDVVTADTPDVAVAVADVVDVVQLADVVDAAADVPRDTGPADAGPVLYDLNQARGALEVHVTGSRLLPETSVCPDIARNASCSITGDTVNFNVEACYVSLTGLLRVADAGASVVFVGSGCVGGCGTASPLRVTFGPRAGLRQSVHVQFAAAPFRGAPGFTGVQGRTADPSLADLWLLGCEVR